MEIINEEGKKKRRGRSKSNTKEVIINEKQSKFFVDLRNEKESLGMIFDLLKKCNEKEYGKPILFKDLCLFGISKLSEKDIDKIQQSTLSQMESYKEHLMTMLRKQVRRCPLANFQLRDWGLINIRRTKWISQEK